MHGEVRALGIREDSDAVASGDLHGTDDRFGA
jgi:hypothetical protein